MAFHANCLGPPCESSSVNAASSCLEVRRTTASEILKWKALLFSLIRNHKSPSGTTWIVVGVKTAPLISNDMMRGGIAEQK